MSKTPNPQQIAHAISVVKGQVTDLRKQLYGKTGEEKAALEAKVKELLASIGLDQTELEVNDIAASTTGPGVAENAVGVGAKILLNIEAATDAAAKINETNAAKKVDVKVTGADGSTTTTTTTVKTEEPGLWQRFKNWCGENKKKVIAGGLFLVAGAAGLWFWLNGKNTAVTVSSVSGVEVNIETPIEPSIPAGETDPSIFARIGAWFVSVGSAIKGYAVSAWSWVKGLFTSNKTVEAPVEVVVLEPAAA
jgi:hypothetical protein